MDISYFKEFAMLADIKNYWSTADRLYISESSLSKHIKSLEKSLGAPLFDRTSRKVTLTEFGMLMLPYAKEISRQQYEYEAVAYRFLEGEDKLNIAAIPVLPQYGIVNVISKFQQEFPQVQVNLQEADTLQLRKWLFDRKCELAFIRDNPKYLEHDPDKENFLVKLEYGNDVLSAVLPKNHPLAEGEYVNIKDLEGENLIFLQMGTMPYQLSMRVCRENGFEPKVVFSSHNITSILNSVMKGRGIALMFRKHAMVAGINEENITVRPISPEIKTNIYLAFLKDNKLSAAAHHFINCFMRSTEK